MVIGRIAKGLGVVPFAAQLIVTAMAAMVNQGASANAAAAAVAQQYQQIYRASEAQITGLALELGRATEIPYWEWFNTLRSVQRLGPTPITDGNGNGNGNANGRPFKIDPVWLAIGGALFFLVIAMRR